MASFPYFTGILKETVGLIKAGASVRETCIHADKRVEEETGKAFKKDKQLQKGKNNHTMVVRLTNTATSLNQIYSFIKNKVYTDFIIPKSHLLSNDIISQAHCTV